MDNFCTIYSHELAFDEIVDVVKNTFPKGKVRTAYDEDFKSIMVALRSGFFKPKKHFQISYRERVKPSYQIADIDSDLTETLAGMLAYINNIKAEDVHIKEQLVQKIQSLNCEAPILSEGNLDEELTELVKNITKAVDGIVFTSPKSINKSIDIPQFLNKELKVILDPEGKSEIDELVVNIKAKYYDPQEEDVTEEQLDRKRRSEELIQPKGISINEHLPCLDKTSESEFRAPIEIAQRVSVLAMTNLVAFGNVEGKEALDYLEKVGLIEYVSPLEIEFLTDPTDEKKGVETWKCECIWVMMWALGLVDKLGFPDELSDLNSIGPERYPIGPNKDPNEFIKAATSLRSKTEILDMADLYYRLDWACIEGRIQQQDIEEMHPGVVYERHYALNWITNHLGEDWDNVTCDT